MAQDAQTGSRIRARRLSRGLRQAALAQAAGISPSYLNLIEHNRRRIGGALLVRIADALQVSVDLLSQGAEAALIDKLNEAAASAARAEPERDRVDDFTGRFPGWAELVAEQGARIATLEHGLARLNDRMTHDPHLAESLHDLLSTITSIRSTAAILAEPGDITPEWRTRFDRNIFEDSRRLAESSQSLVSYLDAGTDGAGTVLSPTDEAHALFDAFDHHFADLERGGEPEQVLAQIGADLGPAAAQIVRAQLRGYASDAARLPMSLLAQAVDRVGLNPVALCAGLDAAPGLVLRRLAHMPVEVVGGPTGLAIADAAGAFLYRKDLPDFPIPHYDACCPLWPVFEVMGTPDRPIMRDLRLAGGAASPVRAYAVSEAAQAPTFGAPVRFHSVMLLLPGAAIDVANENPIDVGTTCRVCPHPTCRARRVASILETGTPDASEVLT